MSAKRAEHRRKAMAATTALAAAAAVDANDPVFGAVFLCHRKLRPMTQKTLRGMRTRAKKKHVASDRAWRENVPRCILCEKMIWMTFNNTLQEFSHPL